ncbi:metal-dependent transcriptional regulator [Micropruina sonneratiae]|uniref:metal-dependent transcriptional regulator n=1 Tax=Micropruina sonneratiae TaxID=2986940 RepID=UPI002226B6F2|nr:metal-dependent transcriptional regulator [Micropruina sp. KQZ13P-5]MCW3156818.1 metal-dependent transcriptional regulator [Micropruina sp. KQZ13P-5]
MTGVDDLTPVAQDYLKVIWSATEWGDPPITSKGLAARLHTSAAGVTDMVKRLAGQGLVDYESYRPVRLTPAGERLAVAMVRRHRLIETFLVRMLGYDWAEVHDEAEALEHAASEQLIERIDALLGHPAADPHGDPIPGADGTLRRPDAMRPGEAQGPCTVVRVSDADPAILARCRDLGIVPGATVLAAEVPAELASAVWVEPVSGRASPC